MIPGFNLEGDMDSPVSLDREHHTENGLELTESRFLLIDDKPKSWYTSAVCFRGSKP